MAFRAEIRRALAAPLGGSLTRHFHVPAVTALVADGRDPDHELVALAELMDALVRVGVPRGRQFVLLAHVPGEREAVRERRARWRSILGAPVLAHDPEREPGFSPGAFADGSPLAVDDELREAEQVVLVGTFARDAAGALTGAVAALWPGMGSAAAAAGADLHRAREAVALVPVDFALLWSAHDPPRVRAGETPALVDACVADGWLDVRGPRSGG